MYRALYSETLADCPRTARARERGLLQKAIANLVAARECPPGATPRREALRFVRELWAAFVSDLSHDDNALSFELRASLISIGVWVCREAERLETDGQASFNALIEINELIADGLRNEPFSTPR